MGNSARNAPVDRLAQHGPEAGAGNRLLEFCRQHRHTLGLLFLLMLAAYNFWPIREIALQTGDIEDYTLPAIHLAQGKGLLHIANGIQFPPEHPFGLMLLIAPAYALLGPDLVNGVYVVFLLTLATVLLTYYVAAHVFDRRVAWLASLFLILAPEFSRSATTILTANAAAFFGIATGAVLLLVLSKPASSKWLWFLLGHIIGYGITVRPEAILFILPVGVLALLEMKRQQQPVLKLVLLGGGVAFWILALLGSYYLYTGDPFRTGQHVHLRPFNGTKGAWNWHNLLWPECDGGGLPGIFHLASAQWSLHHDDRDQVKAWFFYITNILLIIGIIRALWAVKPDHPKRQFLIFVLLGLAAHIVFLGGQRAGTGSYHFARNIPYLFILDAAGAVALWEMLAHPKLLRWWPRRSCAATGEAGSLHSVTLVGRAMLVAGLLGFGFYILRHPYHWPGDWRPVCDYLKHAAKVIPEDDCLVTSNLSALYADHFLVDGTHRKLIPLHRLTRYSWRILQWQKPPHPEWIDEDLPRFDNIIAMDRRRKENGAQDLYPETVAENPEVVDKALAAGKRVYLVLEGPYGDWDIQTLNLLKQRYALRLVESGFPTMRRLPPLSRPFAPNYFIVSIGSRRHGEGLTRGAPRT
jgi:4-amino-4-deoxy-L-arabinose transferase-like glycosyltransferase